MTLQKNVVCLVNYQCRDIGYGVEHGMFRGYWTGYTDCWGKHTFRVVDMLEMDENAEVSDVLYLFPDEILTVSEDAA